MGKNGCGKTTVNLLLAGLFRPTRGQVLISNVDITKLDLAELRRRTAILLQDYGVYPVTLDKNIVPKKGDITGEDAKYRDEALKLAVADEVVNKWPDGLKRPATKARANGLKLSGGEVQRVVSARLVQRILRGECLLVIADEIGAAIDAETQETVHAGLFGDLCREQTVVMVVHTPRVAARWADRIVMIEDGRVGESGTPAELKAAGGLYAELLRRTGQSGEARQAMAS
jgi:ATP-binding cassette subfamily B protein